MFPASGAPFPSSLPELKGLRTKLVKDFPHHVVSYIEREKTIEIIRILRGGQDMSVEVEKTWRRLKERLLRQRSAAALLENNFMLLI